MTLQSCDVIEVVLPPKDHGRVVEPRDVRFLTSSLEATRMARRRLRVSLEKKTSIRSSRDPGLGVKSRATNSRLRRFFHASKELAGQQVDAAERGEGPDSLSRATVERRPRIAPR